jgi:lipid-A-disaccharide synthase-like uncharacterized protein
MNVRKRTKWEPAALMVLVLGLGLWIAFGPASKPKFPTAPDALTQEVRIGNTRGLLEASKQIGTGGEYGFRFWLKYGPNPARVMTRPEAESLLGAVLVEETIAPSRNWVLRMWVFRTLNITSWTSMVWIGIGLLGQVAFSGRMVLQWITSERHRRSVITESFWWFSLFGGLTLFSYFVWRADPIGILGQASGIVVYVRNIRLLRKHARRGARAGV